MIFPVDGGHFVISSHQVYLPGSYDTERTAKYAFRFDRETLQRLQDSVNPGGVITFQMLIDERKMSKEKRRRDESFMGMRE